MESYEDLRLEKKDKIPKLSLMERLFKKNHSIFQDHLDFLEERYQSENKQNAPQNMESQEIPLFESLAVENIKPAPQETNAHNPQEDFRFIESQNTELAEFKTLKTESQNIKEDSNSTSLAASEKEEVLSLELSANEIPFKMVLLAFACMAAVLLLFTPKVYIRSNIYYTSRNIIQLQAQIDSLREENKFIKKQLEDIKFRNLTHELDF